jgi:hypothetical protein
MFRSFQIIFRELVKVTEFKVFKIVKDICGVHNVASPRTHTKNYAHHK